jgi:DNA-binding TFAR19-related protein (PDSD5 family)
MFFDQGVIMRTRKSQRLMLVIVLGVLLGSSLACNLFARREQMPQVSVPVTTEAAQSLATQAQESLQDFAETGQFEISITESELTSLVAAELAKQSEPFLTEPQITLRDGVITVYGKVQQAGLVLNAEMVLEPKFDAAGVPFVEIRTLSLGPFGVPQDLRDQINTTVNEMILSQVFDSQAGMRVNNIDVADGVMTITGSKP